MLRSILTLIRKKEKYGEYVARIVKETGLKAIRQPQSYFVDSKDFDDIKTNTNLNWLSAWVKSLNSIGTKTLQFQQAENVDKEVELVKVLACGVIRWTQKVKAMNRAGVIATTSSNGKYYCDRTVEGEKCCWNRGDNCIDCMDLDRKARSLSRRQLVNSDGHQAIDGTDALFMCGQEIGGGRQCGNTSQRCGPCLTLTQLSKTRYRSLVA